MLKQVFILILFGFAVEARSQENIIPIDLIDDAKAELEQLRQTVLGAIFVAEDDLDNLQTDFAIDSGNSQTTAEISIQQEEEEINDQVTIIKDLARTAGVDISYCLRGREEFINNLRPVIVDELESCISTEVDESSKIVSSSKYLVDISINRVDALEFQLGLCDADGDGCIAPILRQIETETEELPQEIKVEVSRAEDLFNNLGVSVGECSDLKVSQYTSSANTILRDITQCVDAILG